MIILWDGDHEVGAVVHLNREMAMKLGLMVCMNCRIGHELGAHGLYELWDGHESGLMGYMNCGMGMKSFGLWFISIVRWI